VANSEKRIDLRQALLNPAIVFLGPEHVLERDELTREQKIEVLRRWKFDALQLQVADEENMPSEQSSAILDRVLQALHALNANPGLEDSPSTKHGGAALGCVFVRSAVESVDDRILQYLDKGHTRDDVVAALEITRAAEVALRPSLLPFTPWTTLSGYLELLEFVQDHDLVYQLDPVQYSIRLLLPPGSWLLDIPEIQPHVGSLIQEDFMYTWRHPDPRVDMLQRQVARVAEEAAGSGEDPATTFNRIKELALSTIHGRPTVARPRYRRRSARPPHLTEAWFC